MVTLANELFLTEITEDLSLGCHYRTTVFNFPQEIHQSIFDTPATVANHLC
jgi:hypothetical protein